MKRFEPRFGGLQSLFFLSSSPFPLIATTNTYSTKPSACLTSIRNDFAPQLSISLIDDKRHEHMRWFLLSHSFLLDQFLSSWGEKWKFLFILWELLEGSWYTQLDSHIKYLGSLVLVEGISSIVFLLYFHMSTALIIES